MTFRLPWSRESYEPHDVDVVAGGVLVGTIRDAIPEGTHLFRVPPAALRFDDAGQAAPCEVEVRSKHLRGGHYVVSSDFRLKMRLTGSRFPVAAPTAEEAVLRVRGLAGLSIDGPDLAVSSSELAAVPERELAPGVRVLVSFPVRNLGAAVAFGAGARLYDGEREVGYAEVGEVPLAGTVPVELSWTASAGSHRLRVVVEAQGDLAPSNDEAVVAIVVPGEEAPPELEVLEPAGGATLSGTVLALRAEAADEGGIERVEASVDGGLWLPLAGEPREARGLIQPGEHELRVRAVDRAGNSAEKTLRFAIDAPRPELRILEPAEGSSIDGGETRVRLAVDPGTVLAAVRVNGGPWQRAELANGSTARELAIPFGPATIEAMAVDRRGSTRVVEVRVSGAAQAEPGERAGDEPGTGVVEVDLLGPIDFFGPPAPFRTTAAAPAAEVLRPEAPREAAGRTAGPAGGFVVVERTQSDWYCTNRPEIRVPIDPPSGVRVGDIPEPGTEAFQQQVRAMLACLARQGVDTASFERFQDRLIQRARTLEPTRELPGFWEAIGVPSEEPDPAATARWRSTVERATWRWWLRILSSCDPAQAAAGLRRWGGILARFDQALADEANAAIESVAAWQKLVDEFLSSLPVAGDALDLLAMARGQTLSGEELTILQYFLMTLLRLGPLGLEQVLKRPAVREALERWLVRMDGLSPEARRELAGLLGMDEAAIERLTRSIRDRVEEEARRLGRAADHVFEAGRIESRQAGIWGAHTADLFAAAIRGQGEIVSEIPIAGLPGVKVVEYKLYEQMRGKLTDELGSQTFQKTIWDPAVWPKERIADLTKSAFWGKGDGTHEVVYQGVTYIGWIRGGILESFGVKTGG